MLTLNPTSLLHDAPAVGYRANGRPDTTQFNAHVLLNAKRRKVYRVWMNALRKHYGEFRLPRRRSPASLTKGTMETGRRWLAPPTTVQCALFQPCRNFSEGRVQGGPQIANGNDDRNG
jgi:hypothetical protein